MQWDRVLYVPAFLQPFKQDRVTASPFHRFAMLTAAIADYDLTPEERHALLAGDVVTLHHMGVNDFMMGYLARFGSCGLSVPTFNEKIRSAPH